MCDVCGVSWGGWDVCVDVVLCVFESRERDGWRERERCVCVEERERDGVWPWADDERESVCERGCC